MTEFAPLHLLNALTEHEAFDTVVYCTYGVDLAFFEEAVLRPLRRNHCRRHIIFVDSERYADTIAQWRDCTRFVGQQYLLVPVHLPPFQAFHPKLTLLLGAERGRLLLGSGNLTFTGFGHNHELYTCLDWTPAQPATAPIFQAAWQFVTSIQTQWGHNRLVNEALRKAIYQAPWLRQTAADAPDQPAFWHNLHTPLLDQLAQAIGTESVQRITVVTPFLDKQARAVAELYHCFQPAELRLILQQDRAVGDVAALAGLQAQGIPLTLYHFGENSRYLHAKLLLLQTETAVYALSGSANCTRPALLDTPEMQGNVETALLRRAEPAAYFDPLLPPDLLSGSQVSPSEMRLRPHERPEAAEKEAATPSPLQLLDLRLEAGLLHVQLHWRGSLPADVAGLQVEFDRSPPLRLPLTLTNGQEETAVPLPPEWPPLLEQPLSGRLMGLDGEGHPVDIGSNSLWLANAAALTQAAAGWYSGRVGGDVLSAMVAESEEEWRGLCDEIEKLVELDVRQVSQQSPLAAAQSGSKSSVKLPGVERETVITLATAANTLALDEEEMVETAVARESNLQAFLDHIHQRLPGKPATTPTMPPTDGSTVRLNRRKWTPERRTRIRFINLVKKYIASLQSEAYRQQMAVRDSLIYYVIFQRIVWLLHTHQGMEAADCLDYWQGMNDGFFGLALPTSPVASPLHRRLCRYAHQKNWLGTAVPFYALANLWHSEQALAQQPESVQTDQWPGAKWRLLALLRVVVDWNALRQSVETLTPLVEVAQLYEMPVDDLALALLPLLDSNLTDVADILQQWAAAVAFDLHEVTDPQQARLMYQANVDYRRALFHLYGQMGQAAKQQQVVSELIFWARRAGDNDESHQWQARLVALYREDGDERETAVKLYYQAQQYLRDGEYALAEPLAQEALTLANQFGDEEMRERYGRLLGYIAFRLR